MTAPTQPTPPGWYADPSQPGGGQRWWDGTRWTEHRQPGPQQQSHAPAIAPVTTVDHSAKQWALMAHLSAILSLVIGFTFVGPLIVYLLKKDEHPYIRQQAAEALNFNLSALIYATVGGFVLVILVLLIVGILLIPVAIAAAIAWLVVVILAAIKASNGEAYRYPLTIRFVR